MLKKLAFIESSKYCRSRERRARSRWEVAGAEEGNWHRCRMQCPSGPQSLSPFRCGLAKDIFKWLRSRKHTNERYLRGMISIWHGEICLNWSVRHGSVQKLELLCPGKGQWSPSNIARASLTWGLTQEGLSNGFLCPVSALRLT